jgi:hypothetical protein
VWLDAIIGGELQANSIDSLFTRGSTNAKTNNQHNKSAEEILILFLYLSRNFYWSDCQFKYQKLTVWLDAIIGGELSHRVVRRDHWWRVASQFH